MNNERPSQDFFKGTQALMAAAGYIISFEREVVTEDEQKPCTLYKLKPREDGEYEYVEVGCGRLGNIEDLGPEQPEPEKNENWVGLSIA